MPVTFDTLRTLLDHDFDDVIDVRSPAEFAEDHVPGAINLPALSNEQRAEVGTMYVQVAPFEARKVGAAMVARNVADHLQDTLSDRDGGWRPLVYCWRGGQRSGSFASILSQIGWRAETIEGGYQSYRRLVYEVVYKTPIPHRFILLDGNTGTAKTDLLKRLDAKGLQVLDLEGMAAHRGSILGGIAGGQPSQKAFESAIACTLARLDPNRPVLVEAESSKVGNLMVPKAVWAAMKSAARIEVAAPVEARARYLVEAYADVINDRPTLEAKLKILKHHRSAAVVDGWLELLAASDHAALAEALMVQHYDPSYQKSRASHDPEILAHFEVTDLRDADRNDLADRIAAFVDALS